jgi:hypothetical protein
VDLTYTDGVDYYSLERWLLDRHESAVCRAERRARLMGDRPTPRLGAWLAAGLRRLADRIDRGSSLEPRRAPGATPISNWPF